MNKTMPPLQLSKTEIIARIARTYNYKHYLELCTTSTGNFYKPIAESGFNCCQRIMYRCPPDFSDGMRIDYRCNDDNIDSALSSLKNDKLFFDICLVDSWHTYDNSFRDLHAAFDLIADGGALIVHDCLPPSREVATPEFKCGEWCGVSYKAYLDFVLAQRNISNFTVDADYGCGVIFKNRKVSLNKYYSINSIVRRVIWKARKILVHREYAKIGSDYDATYEFMIKNKNALLNLMSADEFQVRFK